MALLQSLPGIPPVSKVIGAELAELKKQSMLHVASLEALYQLAARGVGTILEIGPYIGGSTIALARGLRERTGPLPRLITIEGGGAYDHPQLPSKDILADLELNLGRAGVRPLVDVVAGWTFDFLLIRKVQEMLRHEPAGMLVLDSNGLILADLVHWGPFCRTPCTLVVDDYIESGNLKSPSIQPILNSLIEAGFVCEVGVLPWGTWFGTIVKPIVLPQTMAAVGTNSWRLLPPFTPIGRTGWVSVLDVEAMPTISRAQAGPRLSVCEGNRPLGPAPATLQQIKEVGQGVYTQWGGPNSTMFMFSASDNSDPNRNGRDYILKAA